MKLAKNRPRVSRAGLAMMVLWAEVLGGRPAVALDSNSATLTTPQVRCNAEQLEKLLGRLSTPGGPTPNAPNCFQVPRSLLATYADQGANYRGLAASLQAEPDFGYPGCEPAVPFFSENYLSFTVQTFVTPLLLNPQRLPLGQVTIARENSSSNLVPAESLYELIVSLDTRLSPESGGGAARINNLVIPAVGEPYNGFLASDTRPGRGLEQDGLLSTCHLAHTAFDNHVFTVIQRMVRPSIALGNPGLFDSEIAIYRAEEPWTYRINVFPRLRPVAPGGPVSDAPGHLTAELEVIADPDGRLLNGELRILPQCSGPPSLACSNVSDGDWYTLYMVRPLFGGRDEWAPIPEDAAGPLTRVGPANAPPPAPLAVDFATLLAKTTWNPPE